MALATAMELHVPVSVHFMGLVAALASLRSNLFPLTAFIM